MRYTVLFFTLLLMCSCSSDPVAGEKINGVSFVALKDSIGPEEVAPVIGVNAGYASLMPFGFLEGPEAPKVVFNTSWQWFGERGEGVRQYAETLRQKGIRLMIKPHLWIGRGYFTGDLVMDDSAQWKVLEDSYREYILYYAHLAEAVGAEWFCVGNELYGFAGNRPEFFRKLIAEVRSVYKGKVTYAENWDKYDKISFWDALDMIGVNAYFPLSEAQTPELSALVAAWEPHKEALRSCAQKFNKAVLFTEFGYRSMDHNARAPWDSSRDIESINHTAQVNALKALGSEIWSEEWFAGGFLWKWYPFHDRAGGSDNNRFTVQNKPAQQVIRYLYDQKSRP
ncbi:glycoside hydrolase family 113 [Robertkochia sediminum]|uniref:glycoside hydrolase family 113 n=1 Tax=Robertkochia sediminum TaxID=2785326 RepID=UPI001F323376|nr:glycoside hydrolase [Robertkochia sediminum]